MAEPLDVLGIGSPLLDILARVESDALFEAHGLTKGTMHLVDLPAAEALHKEFEDAIEVSGGSAANTVAGVAALGGAGGFLGRIASDPIGERFTEDLRNAGVHYEPAIATDSDLGTGRCHVIVTPDADRTMATYLGAATGISPGDIPDELLASASVVYLEGYLFDLPPAKEALRRAARIAHDHDCSVALSLSDPFCVERHQKDFLSLLLEDVDVLFGNEEEVLGLFGARTYAAALDAADETGLLVAITRGPKGSVVTGPHGPVEIEAAPVDNVIDTTGAGDLFAAGFLYVLTHGGTPEEAARLGSLAAAEVISHVGARPEADLQELARSAGLL